MEAEADAEIQRLNEQIAYEQQRNANNVALYEMRCRELEQENVKLHAEIDRLNEILRLAEFQIVFG